MKNFNFNFKHLFVLSAVLLLGSTQVWGTEYSLFSGTTIDGTNFVTGGNVNTDGSAKITVDAVDITNYFKFTSNLAGTPYSNNNLGKVIIYNCKTTATRIDIVVYNRHKSTSYDLYVTNIEEGKTGELSYQAENTISPQTKETYTYNYVNTTGRSIYISTSNYSNMCVLSVTATETGTPFPIAGEPGYKLNLNAGRLYTPATSVLTWGGEGLEIYSSSSYACYSRASLANKSTNTDYVKFTTGSHPVILSITTGGTNKYSVNKVKAFNNDSSWIPTASTPHEFNLEASTTYYINPNGSDVKLTKLEFICVAPTGLAASSLTSSGATLTVTDAANNDKYEFYISESSTAPTAGSTATHSVTDSKTIVIDDLDESTTYYAWVRSCNKNSANGKSSWTALTGNTFTTEAAAPSCTDPGAATELSRTSATGTSLTLGWTDGSNADSYKVSLFTDAECTEAATSTEGNDYAVNTNSVTYTGLSLNSTYYFKVQSVGDGSSYCEDGPWSSASGAVKTGVCNDYSFHYGTANADDWTTKCFTQVGETSEWEVADFTIPSKPNWYVGKYGFFYDDGMNIENARSHTDAWSDLFFAASQGNGSGTRPKVGAATGATGRIRIYNNSSWNNLFASFEPDGYKLKFGSSTYGAFEADGSVANCYWSPLMTYNSTTASDLVSVGVIDGSGDYVATNNTEGMKHIFLHVGNTSTLWGKDSWSNFGLYDYTHTQFTCLMTKVPGETCLYEGWVPSTCTQVIFVRLKSSTPAWGDNNSNITDQTGCWTIPANTNMFTISSFSSGSWSAYTKSGQFRMWDNSTEKNWYVHFYPHNVLSYDGNGGSGSMTPQSVKVDAADQELTVAGNGFTREGWTFTGWNTEKHGGGTAYAAGDDIDVTEDITLYAQWERTVYFKVGAGWDDASAWYAIYYFDSSNDSKNGWVKLNTLADCETDVYKGTLPGNGYDKVIVCRMNPASSATNWDNRWNQTGNIDYPTTNVKFTPSSLDGNNCAGAWSAYSTPTFTISYAGGDDAEDGEKDDETKTCNVAFTLPSSAVFTRTGYTQTGWALTENGSQSHSLGGSYTTNADQTFYPVWTQIMVTGITLDPTSKTLTIDETQTITPTVLPVTALDKTVTWTTSDDAVATVDGGVVTAVGAGTATITATANDGSGIYAECAITVNKKTPSTYTFSADNTSICSGDDVTFTIASSQVGATYYITKSSSGGSAIGDSQEGDGSALAFTVSSASTGDYYCFTSETDEFDAGKVSKSKVTISYKTATSITTNPTNVTDAVVGEEASLTVVAAGSGLSYQWKESSTEDGTYSNVASGGTSATYAVTPAAAGTKWYKCVVTGDCGSATTEARKIVAEAAATPLITWQMNTAANAVWGTSTTPTTSDGTNITSIGTSHDEGDNAAKNSATAKTQMATGEVTTSASPSSSARFTFTVNSAKKVTPKKIVCQVFNVSTGDRTYKAQISDSKGNVYNSTNTVAVSAEATLTDATFNFASDLLLAGDVTLKVYAWKTSGSPTTFRMGEYVKFYGTVGNIPSNTLSWDFDGGGCTETAGDDYTASGSVNYGTDITFPSDLSMSKPGYKFTGWSDGTSTYDEDDDFSMPNEDVTFTAQWESFSLPNVSGLGVDDGATLSSIPLSWTIPGICDLSDPKAPSQNAIGTIDNIEYLSTATRDSVTVEGDAPKWEQYGVGFDIPATTGIEWFSFDFYGNGLSSDVVLWGGLNDASYSYWEKDKTIKPLADKTWYNSGNLIPSDRFWHAADISTPMSQSITQVAIYLNSENYDNNDQSFYVRNVRYHVSGQNDIDHIVLMRKEGSAATGIADPSATKLYEGTKSHYTDVSDVTGKNYYYTVFAVHANGAVSTGVSTSLTLYTITYNAGANGTGTVAAGKKTHGIDFTLSSSTFTRDGYTQDGWSTSDGGTKVYELGATYSTDAALTLYPHWVAVSGPVITNGNPANGSIAITSDGSTPILSAVAGSTVYIAATPSTGYNFTSWDVYKTDDASTKVSTAAATASTSFIMPAYAVTVNASFSAKTYTVTLNGNGGSGNTANVTATYGSSSFSSSITNPTKTGYIFDGWYSGTGGTGTLIINSSGVLQSSTTYSDGSGNWANDGAVTLYAKWSRDEKTAKWGLTFNAFPDNSYDTRENITITTTKTSSQDGSGEVFYGNQYYNFGDDEYIDINLASGYYLTDVTYSVHFDPWRPEGDGCEDKGGCNDVDTRLYINFSSSSTYSTSTVLNAEPIALTGNSNGDVSTKYSVASIPSGAQSARIFAEGSFDFGGDLFYLAVERTAYDCTPSTVSFDGGDATLGTAPLSREVCGEMTLPGSGSLVYPGYLFSKWNDGTKDYNEGDTYTVTADVTFTAQWVEDNTSLRIPGSVVTLNRTNDARTTGSDDSTIDIDGDSKTDDGINLSGKKYAEWDVYITPGVYNVKSTLCVPTWGIEATVTLIDPAGIEDPIEIYSTGHISGASGDYIRYSVTRTLDFTGLTANKRYIVRVEDAWSDGSYLRFKDIVFYPFRSITKSATNGTITTQVSGDDVTTAAEGTTIDIAATPNTGYEFTSWTITNTSTSADVTSTLLGANSTIASTSFTMPAYAVTVTGTFSQIGYTIAHSDATNGSYTIKVGDASAVSTNTTGNYNQTVALVATPSSGYVIDGWNVTGATVGNNNIASTSFTMPAGNVTVAPTFKLMPNVYYYQDGTRYASSTYKAPDGSVASSGDNTPINSGDEWTVSNSISGLTVSAKGCTYDGKSESEIHETAYLKVPKGGDNSNKYVKFVVASGYKATSLKMKIGGYSSNPAVTLKPYVSSSLGDAISYTGTVGGVATKENNFNEISWSNLAAGTYYLNVGTNNAYISEITAQTEQVGYTVNFAVDGGSTGYGTVSPSSITEVTHGSTVSISENVLTLKETAVTATPTAESDEYTYAFDSWSVSDGASITSAQTITASFTRTAKEYTLTWDLNGGKVSTAGTAAAVDETEPSGSVAYNTALTAPVVTKSGYDFAGWTPSVADNMPAANTTYTATWAERFTVTYNAMTGSVDPTSATGSTANKVSLPEPTKDGYDFDGWYNTAGEKIGDAGDEYGPTAAIMLYAKWKGSCASGDPVLFSQNINSATAVAFVDKAAITYSTANTLSGLVGSGDDLFTSISYNGSKTGGIAINSASGANSHSASGVIQAYKRDNGAYWSITRTTDFAGTAPTALKVEMDIWFDNTNSGSNYIGPCFAIGDGFSDGLNSTSAQSTSNVHSGFCITDESTPKIANYSDGSTKLYDTGLTESTWLSIAWIINNTGSDLTYDDPDGDGTTTLANDKFDIWLKTQAGAASTYTKVVSAASAITGTKDLQNIHIGGHGGKQHEFMLDNVKVTDLNATPCYQVTYNGNGATSGYVNDPEQYAAGSSVSAKYNSAVSGFERTGYEFVEWNTAANGSGTAYKPFARITSSIDDDIDLYAQWRIVIDANNTDFAGKDDPTQYRDVKVTKGATLTLTQNTAVRDIIVETGSTLNVNTTNGDGTGDGVTLATNSLSLVGGWGTVGNETKYDMPRVYIDQASKITKTEKTINFDIAVDNRNFYPIAVPFPVTVSDVDYVDATLKYYSNYGTSGQYVIKTYDGQKRANADMSNCWRVMRDGTKHYVTSPGEASEVMEPGQGYILRALPASGYGDYAVIRFPMENVDDEWTNGGEKGVIYPDTEDKDSKNAVSVVAYTNNIGGDTKKSNKGWNILGVPYMSCFVSSEMDSDPSDAYLKGLLNITTGEYEKDNDNIYVTVPVHDFSEYIQTPIDEAVLKPGWCFFVQMDKDATLTFDKVGERANAPFRATTYEHMPTVKTGIILSSETASDKTTFLISDKYSAAEYEINADLEKMFGENSYTLATYSLAGETRLAYNAMSRADAANVIPIGYRAPAEGEYTFAINPRYAENGDFERIDLIDYETGFVTNLLQSSYTFTSDRTQSDSRFALNVVPQKETPTDVDNGDRTNGEGANGVRKVIIDNKIYIIRGGRMYDAKGVMVK